MTTRKFSKVSFDRLATCHMSLRLLAGAVLRDGPFDSLLVVEGVRTLETQKSYVARGVSKTMDSKHLPQADGLSHALDLAILNPNGTVNWGKTQAERWAYYVLVGSLYTCAHQMGIKIRSGANWDGDQDYGDQQFFDLFHVELL